jgi:hypothetical protein
VSSGRAIRFFVRFVILGGAAGSLAGFSAFAMRAIPALPPGGATGSIVEPIATQISNRTAKTDRLPRAIDVALTANDRGNFTLASVIPTTELESSGGAPTGAPRALSLADPDPAPAVTELKPGDIAAVPLPLHRPKHLLLPPAQPASAFDDTQISGLKGRLQLTSDQVEYWPPVELALRDVVRTQLNEGRAKHARGGKVNIDVNSPEVQKLILAAMPLLMRLREDQKREVRKLARVIGLEAVASQI